MKARVDRALGALLVLLMGGAVLNVSWQVISRFAAVPGGSFTDELARYLLVWIGLLGAAYAAGQRMHLAVELLPARLGGRAQRVLALGIEAAVCAFALGVLGYGGLRLVALTLLLDQRSAALGLPLAAVYAVLPLAGLLMTFYAAHAGLARGRDPDV